MISNSQRIKAIEEIAKAHGSPGRPKKEWVVEFASDPEHILHEEFDWNDTTAAHKQRLYTAGRLIQKVYFIVEYGERAFPGVRYASDKVRLPVYVDDPTKTNGDQGHESVNLIKKSPEQAQEALRQKLRQIEGHISIARGLAVHWGQSEYFEEALREMLVVSDA